MIMLIVFLVIGMILGYFEIIPSRILDKFNKVPYISLLIILFFMGSKIGMDEAIIGSISIIGLKALIIAIGSILGSLVFIKLFMGNITIPKEKEEG